MSDGSDEQRIDDLPDLLAGVADDAIPRDGMLVGKVGDRRVILARWAGEVVAFQAECPHYGAPLADGCLAAGVIHCPWHHAAFDLADGSVLRPPALQPLTRWETEVVNGRVRVSAETPVEAAKRARPVKSVGPVIVVGAGAAGTAAVLTLRRRGFDGPLALVDPDPSAPYDRPNLSKDYLAGTAPEAWLALKGDADWSDLEVRRVVDSVTGIDPAAHSVMLGRARERLTYDALLLATGAAPRKLTVPGADAAHVYVLRSLSDCRRIKRAAEQARGVVVVGAGFLGLEVAASLRALGLEVHVVAPDAVPLQRPLGAALGREVRELHESRGVIFHLGEGVREIGPSAVSLTGGDSVRADIVVAAVGVEPRVELGGYAGLRIDDGVLVDRFLATTADSIYAAGDIARFPHPGTGRLIRIEHWAVAEAQGRTAALNILGEAVPFADVPFFWTQHYDVPIAWTASCSKTQPR